MAKHGAFQASTSDLYNLAPEEIVLVTDLKHPLYDPRVELPLTEQLVEDVMLHGVQEPVLVAKEGNSPVCVDGRQRVRAAREANKRFGAKREVLLKVPCKLVRGDNKLLFGLSVSLNENRQDDSILDRAMKAQRLLNMGATKDEVRVYFGLTSVAAVARWLKLLETPECVKNAVAKGRLSADAALQFHGVADKEAGEKLQALVAAAPASAAERPKRVTARRAAQAVGKGKAKMKSRSEIEKRLEEPRLAPDYAAALRWVLGIEKQA
jgi:ParB family transcriptional regulator, chromosome partitioning protein